MPLTNRKGLALSLDTVERVVFSKAVMDLRYKSAENWYVDTTDTEARSMAELGTMGTLETRNAASCGGMGKLCLRQPLHISLANARCRLFTSGPDAPICRS